MSTPMDAGRRLTPDDWNQGTERFTRQICADDIRGLLERLQALEAQAAKPTSVTDAALVAMAASASASVLSRRRLLTLGLVK